MNFWQFLDRQIDRLPGWPSERQIVMGLCVGMIWIMFRMARENGTLWEVELFKVILQAFALTGFINMVMAFFFSANQLREDAPRQVRVVNRGDEAVPVDPKS